MPNPGDPIWGRTIGTANNDGAFSVLPISQNQIIATGFTNPFGGGIGLAAYYPINTSSPPSIGPLWQSTNGAPLETPIFVDSCTDLDGNLIFTGGFAGNVNFDRTYPENVGNTIYAAGSDAIFIVKLTSSGDFLWAKALGGVSPTTGIQFGTAVFSDLSITSDKSIVVTGAYYGSFTINTISGPVTLNSYGETDILIVKYRSDGVCLWAKGFGGSVPVAQGEAGWGVAIDPSGNVYVTGGFSGTINFGGSNLTSNPTQFGTTDVFILKLDSSGNHLWSTSFQGSGGACVGSQRYSKGDRMRFYNGNIYIVGQFNGKVSFGGNSKTSQTCLDGFVVKMDAVTHAVSWVNTFSGTLPGLGGPLINRCKGLSIAQNGDVVVGGYFSGSVDFGNGAVSAIGPYDGFVASYRNDGGFNWATHFGVPGNTLLCTCVGVALDGDGNVWSLSNYTGVLTVGGLVGTITSNGGVDWAIIKIQNAQSISPPSPCNFTAVYAPTADGTVFTSKFGFAITSSPTCPPLVMPPGASNILVKYLFPTNTIFPTPNVETPATLLLNYRNPGMDSAFNLGPTYGFYYKVFGGNGAPLSGPGNYAIGSWYWTAAWADSTGARISDWCSDGNTCHPGWVRVVKTTPQNPPDACAVSASAVLTKSDGNIVNNPFANLKTTTLQTVRGPMQIVS